VDILIISDLAERNGVRVEGPKEFILDEGESHYVSVQYKPSCVGFMRCVFILIVKVVSDEIHLLLLDTFQFEQEILMMMLF
jgi:hypothetical protein